jgi:predicted nucleotidyltransferase
MAGYPQPWQQQQYGQQQGYYQNQQYGQQQGYYHNQQYGQQQYHYAPQTKQQLQQSMPGKWQQPGYSQQPHSSYKQQHSHVERSSTPGERPSKRMRGDGSLQQPAVQQQQQQQQQPWQQQQQPRQQGAAYKQLPSSTHSNPAAAAWLDSLQDQIAAFVPLVVPNTQEQQHRDACMAAFTRVAAQSLPEHARAMQVALFGSGAAGLSLHSSDLDVVLTGGRCLQDAVQHDCLQDRLAGQACRTGLQHDPPCKLAG